MIRWVANEWSSESDTERREYIVINNLDYWQDNLQLKWEIRKPRNKHLDNEQIKK